MKPSLAGLRERVASQVTAHITALIALMLPWVIGFSLRRGLRGVYVRGAWQALPPGGVLLAANHHSWWDPYLAWLVGQKLRRPLSGLMLRETVERFPFFRAHGALPTTAVREALRRLARGELLIVFPEGGIRVAGRVEAVRPGLEFLAGRARLPVYPVAFRVVLRGAQYPEAFLLLGEPAAPAEVPNALNALLTRVEADLAEADPEAPVPGYEPWHGGTRSLHERLTWLGTLLRRRGG